MGQPCHEMSGQGTVSWATRKARAGFSAFYSGMTSTQLKKELSQPTLCLGPVPITAPHPLPALPPLPRLLNTCVGMTCFCSLSLASHRYLLFGVWRLCSTFSVVRFFWVVSCHRDLFILGAVECSTERSCEYSCLCLLVTSCTHLCRCPCKTRIAGSLSVHIATLVNIPHELPKILSVCTSPWVWVFQLPSVLTDTWYCLSFVAILACM